MCDRFREAIVKAKDEPKELATPRKMAPLPKLHFYHMYLQISLDIHLRYNKLNHYSDTTKLIPYLRDHKATVLSSSRP